MPQETNTVAGPVQIPKVKPCSGAKYPINYWEQTRSELADTENHTEYDWFHRETLKGTYLPNEFDKTCGEKASFGQIVCPRGADCKAKQGAYPFIAGLGM